MNENMLIVLLWIQRLSHPDPRNRYNVRVVGKMATAPTIAKLSKRPRSTVTNSLAICKREKYITPNVFKKGTRTVTSYKLSDEGLRILGLYFEVATAIDKQNGGLF